MLKPAQNAIAPYAIIMQQSLAILKNPYYRLFANAAMNKPPIFQLCL